eukprot:jgi/Mesvir1/17530/Mv08782-RA.1
MFALRSTCKAARTGTLTFPYGEIATPALLQYTRRGSPVHLTPDIVNGIGTPSERNAGLQINVGHFLESPGADVLEGHGGGIRGFLGIDDGVLVLAAARDTVSPDTGVHPGSAGGVYYTTSAGRRLVSPSDYMRTVQALQPDLFCPLVEEGDAVTTTKRLTVSLERNIKYLDECLQWQQPTTPGAPRVPNRAMLAVIVGGASPELRKKCAAEMAKRDVGGFSLGGFGLGESPEQRRELIKACVAVIPPDKVRHVAGMGMPEEVLMGVQEGLDLFESSYPHSMTVNGFAITFEVDMDAGAHVATGGSASREEEVERSSRVNLRCLTHRKSRAPILKGCSCYTCKNHTRAYLHHLLNCHEMTAEVLLEIHNHHHYLQFFHAIRKAIAEQRFEEYADWFIRRRMKLRLPDE